MRLDPDGLRDAAAILVWALPFVVAFSLAQPALWPVGSLEHYVVYAPLFPLQRPGAGRRQIAAPVRAAVRRYPIGLRRPLA